VVTSHQVARIKAVKVAQRVAEVERLPSAVQSHTTELHRLLDDCQRGLQELQVSRPHTNPFCLQP